jgi:hypothetical protein
MTDREQERAAVVAEYVAAYEAANAAPCPYIIKYARGWFQFWRSGYRMAVHRKAGMLEMTSTLRNRAASAAIERGAHHPSEGE